MSYVLFRRNPGGEPRLSLVDPDAAFERRSLSVGPAEHPLPVFGGSAHAAVFVEHGQIDLGSRLLDASEVALLFLDQGMEFRTGS